MNTLENAVKSAISDIYPFYMPGHKRNAEFFPFNFADIDVTEIKGTDNLHSPGGIIFESMQNAARVFGSEETFYLVGGSTAGVVSSVIACASQGEGILVARNSHKSAYTGMIFAGVKPYYIMPEVTADGLQGGINPLEVERILLENRDIKTILITSPTFEGFVSDIKSIADIAHRHGCILIVDEAHGAHFNFSDYFPESATKSGADIVIQSLHKTLPTLTQTAIIHMNGDRLDRERLRYLLTICQSTSPSYIMMCVADYAIRYLDENKHIFERNVKMLESFRERLAGNTKIKLIGKEQIGSSSIYDVDRGRLCFTVNTPDINGKKLERLLAEKYRVQLEYSGLTYAIGISSPADTAEGFDKLAFAIEDLSKKLSEGQAEVKQLYKSSPVVAIDPRSAFYSKDTSFVPFLASKGEISAGFVIPYPPGIPILAPGERITSDCVSSISDCMVNGLDIVGDGFKDGTLKIINEFDRNN